MKIAKGLWNFAAAIWLCAAVGAGCGGVVAGVYETCNGACAGGTTCVAANVTTGGFSGDFCTNGCDPTNPVCPDDGTGIPPLCVATANDPANGECYAGCPSGGGCPYGETCGSYGGYNFCVP